MSGDDRLGSLPLLKEVSYGIGNNKGYSAWHESSLASGQRKLHEAYLTDWQTKLYIYRLAKERQTSS